MSFPRVTSLLMKKDSGSCYFFAKRVSSGCGYFDSNENSTKLIITSFFIYSSQPRSLKGKACGKIDLPQCLRIFLLDPRGLMGRVYSAPKSLGKVGKRIYSRNARKGIWVRIPSRLLFFTYAN
jgi:hypothetical protein